MTCNGLPQAEPLSGRGLDQLRQFPEALLPTEAASSRGDHVGDALLLDGQLRTHEHSLEWDRDPHLSWQVGVVELVRVDNPLAGHDFEIRAAEGMTLPRGEVAKRHPVFSTGPRVHVMDRAGE
jgi:hypothetical protein